jgi:hypothetical protein
MENSIFMAIPVVKDSGNEGGVYSAFCGVWLADFQGISNQFVKKSPTKLIPQKIFLSSSGCRFLTKRYGLYRLKINI